MGARQRASFVIPCLNEEKTIGLVLDEAQKAFANQSQIDWEIVVADNGSTDKSREIAQSKGAKVISISERGYGSAVHGGILNASGDYVVYADADGTYSPADAIPLVKTLEEKNADLVLGSRMKGTIFPGAMPFLHRYLGTPVLSFLIRWLHGIPTSDCNSGIRGVRKSAYQKWAPLGSGMEYASMMLIRAQHEGAKILEFPVSLRPSPPGRIPHLRSWRDGMRHLLIVLASAPHFFWRAGAVALVTSLVLASLCLIGNVHVGPWGFGPHTLALTIVIGFLGCSSLNTGLILYLRERETPWLVNKLLHVEEGTLFWALVAMTFSLLLSSAWLLVQWSEMKFGGLDYVKFALGTVYFEIVGFSLILGLFQVHLMKRLRS